MGEQARRRAARRMATEIWRFRATRENMVQIEFYDGMPTREAIDDLLRHLSIMREGLPKRTIPAHEKRGNVKRFVQNLVEEGRTLKEEV